MIQIQIKTKNELLKAINSINIKKIQTKEIQDQKDLSSFINEIRSLISPAGTLTLLAIKE
jgi:hypothetical protein